MKNLIVKHIAGSHAYGTSLPTSDRDVRGIFCADRMEICTPFFPVREVTLPEEEDGKVYELCNFMKLYCDGNPNILESLWIDTEDIIRDEGSILGPYFYLREKAPELLSSKVAFTFSGYAISQLKRIKGHHKWINNPQPEEPPKHRNYLKMVQNFTEEMIMPRDFGLQHLERSRVVHYGNNIFGVHHGEENGITSQGDFNLSLKQTQNSDMSVLNDPLFIFRYIEDEYKRAKENHHNYWTWKNNRNEARSELEEKFGYDTKHAMHLVRLLRMGEEILEGRGVIVKRPDADELLEIRNGRFEYEQLIEWAEKKDKYIRETLYQETKLPKKPNIKLAANTIRVIQDWYWNGS